MPLQWSSLGHGEPSQQPGLTLSSELKNCINKLFINSTRELEIYHGPFHTYNVFMVYNQFQ